MEIEFDKEIDALLRQAAQPELPATARDSARQNHLDADEISAFAENALPVKMRARVVEHLADCNRCRKVLSNIIVLNPATENEKVGEKQKILTAAPSVAWYKKLLSLPKTAYAMGALALVFGGIFAFVTFENSARKNSPQVAQISEKAASEKGIDAATNTNSSEINSPANFANSLAAVNNSSVSSNNLPATTTKKNTPVNTANGNVARLDKSGESAKPKPITPPENIAAGAVEKEDAPPASAAPKKENSARSDEAQKREAPKQQGELAQNSAVQNQAAETMSDSQYSRRAAPAPRRAEMKAKTSPAGKTGDDDRIAETRTVGGKNFRRAGGVWYDTSYNGQPTTNISRGSDAYRKLDAGLRAIAENLGGAVVALSGGRAYRIQ